MMPFRCFGAARLALLALTAVMTLTACPSFKPHLPKPPEKPPDEPTAKPPEEPPTREFPGGPEVRESVYLPVDRRAPPPAGYGLYTVLLTRAADRNTVRVLSELFANTSSAGEAALARGNLNLITIPVKSAAEAARALAQARSQPDASATQVVRRFYDFGQAALLMASVCHADRGAAVMKVCGSASPNGPLLVTSQHPLDGAAAPGQRLLVVNLSTTPPEALREVLAAYRKQILRKDFADRADLDGWRLWALNHILDAAQLLPGLSKAYAGNK